ncbi:MULTISPECIES: GNAT family N-acetyltransferase [unclassified Lactobacillus]|uniref:GNAT family N-acetyltransferase n=1 Tax=unclassified Lactobacillus TaxID=2620435 RepID=UPI000EFD0CD4|nr:MULTISPECIES: GNAT family N-acetyltransferase [unclassified Lactobacillus]RMC25125.1 N-acetyltransferase [Lactobacillus sp. ESL0247]RMC29280.1 N-acetyltransferase [Lactobacillus sp. ESL0246]RMC32300.1 N-acetyltransferase [Lactobacillus sp. ESL0245]
MTAFPKEERIPTIQLVIKSLRENIYFQAIYNDDQFIGLIFVVEGKIAVYLGFLAITSNQHGHGYGSQVLQILRKRFIGKQIILDIEPVIKTAPNYEQRVMRLHFYERNGFSVTRRTLKDDGGRFTILTSDGNFDKNALSQLLNYMGFNLYKFKIE